MTGPSEDLNVRAAGLLQDLALLQSNERSRFGYKRAAKVLASGLDRSVADLVADGTLRDVPYIGASTERIVKELVTTGGSPTVERAVEASSRRGDVEKRRTFRRAYLSRHAMRGPTPHRRGAQPPAEQGDHRRRARLRRRETARAPDRW